MYAGSASPRPWIPKSGASPRHKASGIVTMDEDFQHLAARYGTPPQVVWVRLGNVRKPALLNAFAALLPQLVAGLESGTPVIEIG